MSHSHERHALPEDLLRPLLASRSTFLAHVRRKLSSPELAEDVLQESYVRALRAAPQLHDRERLLPWFYRILNNAVIDIYRRQAARPTEQSITSELEEILVDPPPEDRGILCECFRSVLPTLKPEYAELLERIDLREVAPASVARELGITPNNLKVRHHRARQALRQRLEESCRLCARHGCLDCTCSSGSEPPHGAL